VQRRFLTLAAIIAVAPLTACYSANEHAMQVGQPPADAVKLRALQTRRFDTVDEKAMLAAATGTLQDLGFIISESSPEVGVLTATKQRDAEEAGQVVGAIAVTVVLALLGAYANPTWDKEQTIEVTLVATPVENSKQVEVRTAFDRVLTNNHGQKWRAELIEDEALYRGFFEKLSKSVFLEAHAL
jgi:hypothetical protein